MTGGMPLIVLVYHYIETGDFRGCPRQWSNSSMTLAAQASSKTSNRPFSEASSTRGVSCRSSNSRPTTEAMVSVSLHRWDSILRRRPMTSRTPSRMRTVHQSLDPNSCISSPSCTTTATRLLLRNNGTPLRVRLMRVSPWHWFGSLLVVVPLRPTFYRTISSGPLDGPSFAETHVPAGG